MRFGPIVSLALLVAAGAAGFYWVNNAPTPAPKLTKSSWRRGGGGGAVPVTLAHVGKERIPVYRQGIGNVVALMNVTVRPQVDGRLIDVAFVEGQDVRKGDVLARIDPTLYQAAYDQALARRAQDQATLANARIDLERYRRLARDNAGPKQQADQQAAQVAQLEAQVKADDAAIESAKATLGYTTITAPFDGRIGFRAVDPGNLVRASDSGGIANLTQIKPIAIVFTLPQRDLQQVAQAQRRGEVAVEALKSGETAVLARGTLQAIDNQIDMTTGTFRLKAVFPNDDLALWPGQFVSTRVIVETLEDARTVPAAAIRRGPSGTFVYLVGEDRRAVVTPVDVVLQDDTRAVIAKGVNAGDSVVTVGFAQLRDGSTVVVPGAVPAAAPRGAGAKGERPPGKGSGKRKRGNGKEQKKSSSSERSAVE